VKLYTMTGADWTKRYPQVVEAAIVSGDRSSLMQRPVLQAMTA